MPSSILNSDDGVISGTAGLKNSGGDDAVLLIQTKGVTAQTVDAGQRTMFPTTIGVGGATPSTSGSGISFPASASASTDANTLDDYEEGTWTPSLGGNATYTNRDGVYTKIGDTVHVRFQVHVNTLGTGSTNNITGMPFSSEARSFGGVSLFLNLATSVIYISPYGVGTDVTFISRSSSGTSMTDNPAIFGDSARIFAGLIYKIS